MVNLHELWTSLQRKVNNCLHNLFQPEERAPATLWARGLMALTAYQALVLKRQILLYRKYNVIQPHCQATLLTVLSNLM